MHADNDYCRRGRTMMHGGGGSVSQKVYLVSIVNEIK